MPWSNQCPVTDCRKTRDRRDLMCKDHWRSLPKALQAKVNWEARQCWGSQEHKEAARGAVDEVQKILGLKVCRSSFTQPKGK